MNGDPARVLLVLSARPHPWALLRDKLDPRMVRVVWRRPGSGLPPRCWAAAGEGPGTAPPLPWPVLLWWVGEVGAPAVAQRLDTWRAIAATAERALRAELGGVRLAPTCGLYVHGTATAALPDLETLLSASDGGVPSGPGEGAYVRRARAAIARHHLPLELTTVRGVARLRVKGRDVRSS